MLKTINLKTLIDSLKRTFPKLFPQKIFFKVASSKNTFLKFTPSKMTTAFFHLKTAFSKKTFINHHHFLLFLSEFFFIRITTSSVIHLGIFFLINNIFTFF